MPKINKYINKPDNIVKETVKGYIKAYEDKLKVLEEGNVVARKTKVPGKVGIVIGNGSGHEPANVGFVGENMLDCNAYGELFAAPGPYAIYDAIKEADTGNGVLVLISSHAGDILNSKIAIDMATEDGIKVDSVVLYDDVASADKNQPHEERRGSIGTVFAYKIAGSYSSEMKSLAQIKELVTKVRDNTRTICSSLKSGTSPVTGKEMFELADGEVLIGQGVHGEGARNTVLNKTSNDIALIKLNLLLNDIKLVEGDTVSVIINGMGQTTMGELMIFYNFIYDKLSELKIKIFKPLIGEFITTQEMAGIGLSILKMDEEMQKQWVKPTDAPHFPNL